MKTETKITYDGKEIDYMRLIDSGDFETADAVDNLIDELRDLPTMREKKRGIKRGALSVWEEPKKNLDFQTLIKIPAVVLIGDAACYAYMHGDLYVGRLYKLDRQYGEKAKRLNDSITFIDENFKNTLIFKSQCQYAPELVNYCVFFGRKSSAKKLIGKKILNNPW